VFSHGVPGTDGVQAHNSYCLPCPSGRYYERTGAANKLFCKDCPYGRYAKTAGSASCRTCSNVDKFGSASFLECVPTVSPTLSPTPAPPTPAPSPAPGQLHLRAARLRCKPGQFSQSFLPSLSASLAAMEFGSKPNGYCMTCPPGKFNPANRSANGGLSCMQCQAGMFSHTSADSHVFGLGGTAAEGAVHCKTCPGGKFSPTGWSTCTDCADGRFSSSPKAGLCAICPTGKYQRATGSQQCESCASGQFGTVVTVRRKFCHTCPHGKFQNQPAHSSCR
jgi:hypothetical protein